MIVELIGMPGAGKSTIINRLLEEESELKLKKYQEMVMGSKLNKIRGISFIGFALINSLRFFPLFIKAIKGSKNKNYTIKRLQKLLVMLHNLETYQKDDILVMDQGIAQLLISIFGVNNQKNNIPYNEYLSSLLKTRKIDNYKLIYIQTPLSVASNRIMNRDKANCEFKKMDTSNRLKTLFDYSVALDSFQVDIICNSAQEVKFNTELIASFISK